MQGTKKDTCKRCAGKGVVQIKGKYQTCPDCRGSGKSADYSTK